MSLKSSKQYSVAARLGATLLLCPTFVGCGNDHTGLPSPVSLPPAAMPTSAVHVAATERFVSSPAVSNAGAVNLTQDCNFEVIDNRPFAAGPLSVNRKGGHEFRGWIVDPRTHSIPRNLTLVLAGVVATNGTWINRSPIWMDRKGVAETRGYGPALNDSGFSFYVDSSDVPVGAYHVYVISGDSRGAVKCDPGRQVIMAE